MRIILLLSLFLFISCAKNNSVLICGDHECINKSEAKQYFENNLSIEVQIKTKNKEVSYDLVDLNLSDKQNIQILKKDRKKIVRKLSKKEIKKKKKELKNKKKTKKNDLSKINKKRVNIPKEIKTTKKLLNNSSYISEDICQKLKNCDIDSITNYLIKLSNEKNYPNISLKE